MIIGSLSTNTSNDLIENLDIINLLKKIGFSNSEALVYLELVKCHKANANVLCTATNIKDSKIYGILAKLEQLGLLTVELSSPKIYHILPLAEGLENILQRIEFEYFEKKRLIKELEIQLSPFFDSMLDVTDIALIIKGQINVWNQLRTRLMSAKQTITLIVPTYDYFQDLESILIELHVINIKITVGIFGKVPISVQSQYPFEIISMLCSLFYVIIDDNFLFTISKCEDPKFCYALFTSEQNLLEITAN